MSDYPLHQHETVKDHGGPDHQYDQGNEQQQSAVLASEPAGHDGEQEDDLEQEDDDDHHHREDEQPYDEQALAALVDATDWTDAVKRLIAYASFRLLRFPSAKRAGQGPDDFAQQAITLVLKKQRRLDLSGDISLFAQLCSICDSLISHAGEKARRRIDGGMAEVPIAADDEEDAPADHVSEDRLGAPADFEIELIARDRFECFARALEPKLAAYVRLRVTGRYATAEEYAKALSTTVKEIRNLDRQLWRRRNLYDMPESRQALRAKTRPTNYPIAMGA